MPNDVTEDIISIEFVISPDSGVTPASLHGTTLKFPVKVRETCSGIVIRGKRSDVENTVNELRKIKPYSIFVKARGSRVGLHRIYRGFLQMEGEYKSLPTFSRALKKVLEKDESAAVKVSSEKKELSPEKLSQIFNEKLSEPKRNFVFMSKEAYLYPIFSKYRNFDVFWVCKDKNSLITVAAGSTQEEVAQKAKRLGYAKFFKEYPPFSVTHSEGGKLEFARMVICQCAPSAVDIDAVLILHKDGSIGVHCPLGDMCRVWCPYGEVELMACNRTNEAARLILIRSVGKSPHTYIPRYAKGNVRYFLMTDRRSEWTQRYRNKDAKGP